MAGAEMISPHCDLLVLIQTRDLQQQFTDTLTRSVSRLGESKAVTQQFPTQKKFSELHCDLNCCYLRSMECKIDDINNIGSRGVSKPQAGAQRGDH